MLDGSLINFRSEFNCVVQTKQLLMYCVVTINCAEILCAAKAVEYVAAHEIS